MTPEERHSIDPIALEARLTRLEERLDSANRARALQATEYERRLGELNHEAARLLAVSQAAVSRETWDLVTTEWGTWRRSVEAALSRTVGQTAAVGAIVTLLLALGSLAVALYVSTT